MDRKNSSNLDRMRSLVMGNMPRTIVHTARQPINDRLRLAIEKLSLYDPSEVDFDEILITAAKTFIDAEDDRAAAAALAIIIMGVRDSKDERLLPVFHEIKAFIPKARAIYLREYKKESSDTRFDDMLEYREFCERAHTKALPKELLVVRYIESVDVFLDESLPPRDDPDFLDRITDRGHWLELTLNKVIDRCRDYLREPVTGDARDVAEIKKILSLAEILKKNYTTFMESPLTLYTDAHTWSDVVVNEED